MARRRVLETDPVHYADQMNLYAYVGNDPLNATDPTGMCPGPCGWARAGGVARTGEDARAAVDDGVAAAVQEVREDPVGLAIDVGLVAIDIANVPSGESVAMIGARRAARDVVKTRAADAARATCCFVAGTLVETREGLRPIEDIEVGDLVLSRDEATGETGYKPVTELVRRHERVIWEVVLTGPEGEAERFETTDDHPWWIAGVGWKPIEDLAAGMAMVTADGRGMVVASVVETDRADATYNLTVAEFETYFVGGNGVLVHNCPTGSYTNTHASGKTYHGKGDAARAVKSGRKIAKAHEDPLVKTETQSHATDRESFKQEARNLANDGGAKSNSNYNKIESPGKKMLEEDGG